MTVTPAAAARAVRGAGDPAELQVDDHRVVQVGLRSYLESFPDVEVVGEASDGAEAVELAAYFVVTMIVAFDHGHYISMPFVALTRTAFSRNGVARLQAFAVLPRSSGVAED